MQELSNWPTFEDTKEETNEETKNDKEYIKVFDVGTQTQQNTKVSFYIESESK